MPSATTVRTASVTATLVRGRDGKSGRVRPIRDIYQLSIQTYGRHATRINAVANSLDDMVDAARAALADHHNSKMSDWRITRASVNFT